VGLGGGAVVGLARTWEKVDWLPAGGAADAPDWPAELRGRVRLLRALPPEAGGYDLLVLAGSDRGDLADPRRLTGLLRPGGTIVSLGFAGAGPGRRDLRRAGLGLARRYAALPRRRPRLFVPLASARALRRGLGFHLPGSRPARRMTGVARSLARVGWKHFPRKWTLTIASRGEPRNSQDTLAGWLSQALGPVRDLVVYAGSDSPRRRITALAVGDDRGEDSVVKVGDTAPAAEANRREAAALNALRQTPLAGSVPRTLLHEADCRGCDVHAQSAVPALGARQVPELTDEHFAFLSRLSGIDRRMGLLNETRAWRRVCEAARCARPSTWLGPLGRALALVRRDDFARRPVVCHRTHGDFVPWNIRRRGRRLFVIDWEASDAGGPALTDLFTFLYRQAACVGPWPGAARLARAMQRAAGKLAAQAGYPPSGYLAAILTWMLREHLVRPDPRLQALCESVLGSLRKCAA
jgi:hypothetical protein